MRIRRTSSTSLPYDTPTGTMMRTSCPVKLQFVTCSEMNSELGTMMAMLSLVTMVVARALIFRTSPATSPTSTRSPTLIGRSKRMTSPLTKLLVTFWRPKPRPTPSAPASTARALRLMPALWRMTTMPIPMIV